MSKLFHYATGPVERFQNGLVPRSTVIGSESKSLQDMLPWIRNPYSFCFLDSATPPEWIVNFSGEYWNQIRTHTGDLLLAFDAENTDDIHVLDFSHIARSGFPHSDEALKRYFKSRISLSEYSGGYQLPECIVGNTIPKDRISISGNPEVGPKYKRIIEVPSLDRKVNYILQGSPSRSVF